MLVLAIDKVFKQETFWKHIRRIINVDDLLNRLSIESIKDASSVTVINLAKEYGKLASLPTLSEQQQLRLEQILQAATEDDLLDFWITEIDHIVGHELGILDDNSRQDYQNQQALLREHLGDVIANNPTGKTINNGISQPSQC